jgi:hypothetical protein
VAFTFITVTRTYKPPAGHAAQGYVRFIPSSPMINGTTTISAPEQATLSKTGAISISLAANNDPSTTPTGTTYRVTENLSGQASRSYDVIIPYNAAGGTVDLSTLAPVTTTAPAVQYVSSVNGQSGAVTLAGATDATTSAKGVSRILGGTADAPTVPWASLTGVDADLTGLAGLSDGFPSRSSGTWAARTAPQLLSDIGAQPVDTLLTRMAADPVTVAYAASITPDASQSCVFDVTATGNLILADISNGMDGQTVSVRVTASGGTRMLTVTGIYTVALAASSRWVGWFKYDGAGSWQLTEANINGVSGPSGVTSVNGLTGVVTLTPDSFTDGTTNHVFTAADDTKLAGIATGATANSSDATLLARANHTGTQSADTLTDGTTNKAFLATERTKLTGIATSATANSSDATLLARANHTGTQAISTVTSLQTSLDAKANVLVSSSTHTGNYSIVLADAEVEQVYDSTSTGTFTLPTNATQAIPVGSSIPFRQVNTGQLTIAAAGGVTLQARGSAFKLAGQHAVAEARKTAADTWVLYGDISA